MADALFAEPHMAAHTWVAFHGPVQEAAVREGDRTGRLALVGLRKSRAGDPR